MCGSWNLPMFLLRDGSFTLMKIASFMFLAILLSSLPTIIKLSRETSWPVVFWWSMIGDGALMCSLYLSPNVLPDSPMYSSSQSTLPNLYLYITPLFLSMVSLSLGCTRRSLIVLPPLKYTSTPYLLQMFLQVSPKPFIYGTTMQEFLMLLFPWLFFSCFFLMLVLFQAHKGYMHLLRALYRWSSSSVINCLVEHTVFSLCLRVLMTLYFADR